MAGSWRHMTTKSGKLRSNESFTAMIENLGDAYEAAEECYGMVWYLAAQLAYILDEGASGQQLDRVREVAYLLDADFQDRRQERDRARDAVNLAAGNYKDGLRLGGVQRSH